MSVNQKPDYGPAGCCGPTVYAALLLVVGGLTALGMWLA
jgi:hypothetical protein